MATQWTSSPNYQSAARTARGVFGDISAGWRTWAQEHGRMIERKENIRLQKERDDRALWMDALKSGLSMAEKQQEFDYRKGEADKRDARWEEGRSGRIIELMDRHNRGVQAYDASLEKAFTENLSGETRDEWFAKIQRPPNMVYWDLKTAERMYMGLSDTKAPAPDAETAAVQDILSGTSEPVVTTEAASTVVPTSQEVKPEAETSVTQLPQRPWRGLRKEFAVLEKEKGRTAGPEPEQEGLVEKKRAENLLKESVEQSTLREGTAAERLEAARRLEQAQKFMAQVSSNKEKAPEPQTTPEASKPVPPMDDHTYTEAITDLVSGKEVDRATAIAADQHLTDNKGEALVGIRREAVDSLKRAGLAGPWHDYYEYDDEAQSYNYSQPRNDKKLIEEAKRKGASDKLKKWLNAKRNYDEERKLINKSLEKYSGMPEQPSEVVADEPTPKPTQDPKPKSVEERATIADDKFRRKAYDPQLEGLTQEEKNKFYKEFKKAWGLGVWKSEGAERWAKNAIRELKGGEGQKKLEEEGESGSIWDKFMGLFGAGEQGGGGGGGPYQGMMRGKSEGAEASLTEEQKDIFKTWQSRWLENNPKAGATEYFKAQAAFEKKAGFKLPGLEDIPKVIRDEAANLGSARTVAEATVQAANVSAIGDLRKKYTGSSRVGSPMHNFLNNPNAWVKRHGTTRDFKDSKGVLVKVGWGGEKVGTGDGQVAIAIDNPDKFTNAWWGELSEKLGYSEAHPDRVWQSSFGEAGIDIKEYANALGKDKAPSLFKAIEDGDIQGVRKEVYGLNGLGKYGGGKVEGLKKWWGISKNDEVGRNAIISDLYSHRNKNKNKVDGFLDHIIGKTSMRYKKGRGETKSMLKHLNSLEPANDNELFKSMVNKLIKNQAVDRPAGKDKNGETIYVRRLDSLGDLTHTLSEFPEYKQDYTPVLNTKIKEGKDYWGTLTQAEKATTEVILKDLKHFESHRRGVYIDVDKLASSYGINSKGNFNNIYKNLKNGVSTTVLSDDDARKWLPLSFLKSEIYGGTGSNQTKMKTALSEWKEGAVGLVSSAWQYGIGVMRGVESDYTLSQASEQVMGLGGYHQSFQFTVRNFNEHSGVEAIPENKQGSYSAADFNTVRGRAYKDYYNGITSIETEGIGVRVNTTYRSTVPSGVRINETGAAPPKQGYMFIDYNPDTKEKGKVPGSSDNDVFRLKKNASGEFVTTIIRENGEFLVNRAENGRLTIDETPIAGGLTHDDLPKIISSDDRAKEDNTSDTFLKNNAGNAFFRQYTTPNGGTRHEFFGANSVLLDYTMKRKKMKQPGSVLSPQPPTASLGRNYAGMT